ncbi:MAG: MFS transporter, partial [Burkholderiales bacterium]|nr:MFS transporter [Burkholderiales bacterium]
LCLAFGRAETLYQAAFFVFGAFLGSGLQWVFSAALLQKAVEDQLLGRVLALDNASMTLTASVSTLLCGWGLVAWGPRIVADLVGITVLVACLAWLGVHAWWRPLDFDSRPQRASLRSR